MSTEEMKESKREQQNLMAEALEMSPVTVEPVRTNYDWQTVILNTEDGRRTPMAVLSNSGVNEIKLTGFDIADLEKYISTAVNVLTALKLQNRKLNPIQAANLLDLSDLTGNP